MEKHLTDGELRAALDGELEADRSRHLQVCAGCQERQAQIQANSQQAARLLGFLTPGEEPVPSVQAAWNRFNQEVMIKKELSMFKRWFSYPMVRFGTATLLILALVLAFPGTRAMAGELLNLFRVQQVTVVPVDFTGLEQLNGNRALGDQFTQLISQSMVMKKKPGDPVQAASADEASKLAGFAVRLPAGSTPSQIYVMDSAAFTVEVNREKAQALLDEAGRRDLVLPNSVDGADISVNVPASVSVSYGTCPKPQKGEADHGEGGIPGRRYPDCVMLVEMPSPTVDAPASLNIDELAQIGLEFTGMSKEDAASFTKNINWASTLVIPIPRNAATYQQVTVDGVSGTLIQRPADDAPQYVLIWIKDGIIHAISGLGTNSQQAVEMANSLK
ncbi:MAG: anti-sigma factor family protein [Bacteroidota bacterium]